MGVFIFYIAQPQTDVDKPEDEGEDEGDSSEKGENNPIFVLEDIDLSFFRCLQKAPSYG